MNKDNLPIIMPRNKKQKKMVEETLHKLRAKKLEKKLRFRIPYEPSDVEGVGDENSNVPLGYSADGEN